MRRTMLAALLLPLAGCSNLGGPTLEELNDVYAISDPAVDPSIEPDDPFAPGQDRDVGDADGVYVSPIPNEFVHGVAMPGDLDGDGYADLVIGAPDATGSVGEVGAGAVRVWAAGPAGIDDAPFLAVEGSAADTGLGRSPGALLVADLDLDGVDDLAWGLPYDDSVGANAGAIGLLYGPVRGSMEHTRADRILTGPGTTAYLGTDLALAEVDGLPEALVAGSTYGLSLGGEALLLPLDALR